MNVWISSGLIALWVSPPAAAHGERFSLSRISASPDDPDIWWANANGWGVVYTLDAGATWAWRCEEGIGASSVYDVLAIEGGQALLATSEGLQQIDADCASSMWTGLPADSFAGVLARGPDVIYAAVFADGDGSLFRCAGGACEATSLTGTYVKSVRAIASGVVYVTTVDPTTLAAALWTSTDGQTFTPVQSWPDGDYDVRVLYAEEERLLLWRLPRSDADIPALLYSSDGGVTHQIVLTDGQYTDPVPGLAVSGQNVWLGSDIGRTWRSLDGGRHYFEVSETEPAVRCGEQAGDRLLICSDHFADGFDAAVWQGGQGWAGAGCLDGAEVDSCASEACEVYADAFYDAGAFGGGECYAAPEDPTGCGSSAMLLPGLWALGWGTRRMRSGVPRRA